MITRGVTATLVVALVACSQSEPRAPGQIVAVISIDWEGAYVSPDGLDAIDTFRETLPGVPFTHYVSTAYFTKADADPKSVEAALRTSVRTGDELAVHLHAWRSLSQASQIEPKLSPSFLTGTDALLDLQDGDLGFDTDLDVYSVIELRALLRTSRRLLEQTALPVSRTFRAGGYLGTPKMLQALYEEGYTVDSSATDFRQLEEQRDELPLRVRELWPAIESTSQPYMIDAGAGQLLEMPIAAIADYAQTTEIVGLFEAAHKRLQADPDRDVFVVLGFHQETAPEFSPRIAQALAYIRKQPELYQRLAFSTLEAAAERARVTLAASP